jgi:hypothetical protein
VARPRISLFERALDQQDFGTSVAGFEDEGDGRLLMTRRLDAGGDMICKFLSDQVDLHGLELSGRTGPREKRRSRAKAAHSG